MNKIEFFINYLKDPQIAAIVQTSKFTVKSILEKIDFANVDCVIEYGPGDGVVTKELLKRMNPDSKLFAFEMNRTMLKELKKINDKRLVLVNDLAQNLPQHMHGIKADLVVSGIPFSKIKGKEKSDLIKSTANALNDQGTFVVYQYTPAMKKHLQPHFSRVETALEPFNIPPTFIMTAHK